MALSQVIDDYYEILGVTQSAGHDSIRANYEKLALKHHLDRNPNNPQATAQLKLIETAYLTLFDPEQRRLYDIRYVSIKSRYQIMINAEKSNTSLQVNGKTSVASRICKLQMDKAEAELQELRKLKRALGHDLLCAWSACQSIQKDLDELQAEADRDAQEEKNESSWVGYIFSTRQSEEKKQVRQRRMVDNRAARTALEAELKIRSAFIAGTQSSVEYLDAQIQNKLAEKGTLHQKAIRFAEAQQQEAVRVANIIRWQAMKEEREEQARAEVERVRKEQRAKRVRREREAERVRRAQEAREVEEEMWKRDPNTIEAMKSGETTYRWKKASTENKVNGKSARTSAGRASACLHKSWWNQEEGRHMCERCLTTTSHYAFRCPGCRVVACAGCRNILKRRV